jgi:hypothetical protein
MPRFDYSNLLRNKVVYAVTFPVRLGFAARLAFFAMVCFTLDEILGDR